MSGARSFGGARLSSLGATPQRPSLALPSPPARAEAWFVPSSPPPRLPRNADPREGKKAPADRLSSAERSSRELSAALRPSTSTTPL